MERLKVFLASSWDTKDKPVTDYFETLLKRLEYKLNIRSVKDRRTEKVQEKIYNEIDNADVVIGLYTKESFDDSEKIYKPPVWVVSEINYALGRQKILGKPKKLLLFRDEEVPRKEATFIALEGHEIVPFNSNNLDANREQYDQYLKDLYKTIDIHPELTYKINDWTWIITVFLNGNGMLRNKCSVVILEPKKFMGVRHGFELNIEDELPTLTKLKKSLLQERFINPFFSTRLIRINQTLLEKEIELKIKSIQSTNKKKSFYIQFPFRFKVNDVLEYEWAWGFRSIFPKTKRELRTKRFKKKSYAEAHLDLKYAEVTNLSIQINFERGSELDKVPFIGSSLVYEDKPSTITRFSDIKKTIFYDSYLSSIIKNPYGFYMVRWVPK